LQQIHPHVEEAARSLGRSAPYVFLTVTLPLMRSALLVSAAGVFLITMKELPATLILSPIGFKTLATSTWSAASAAFFARAAAPAMLLILVSSVPVALIVLRERRSET
jgi:iron(III) transport system permease protein